MGWCPECEVEYVAGITVCADCGCKLVPELPKKAEKGVFSGRDELTAEFLREIEAGLSGDEASELDIRDDSAAERAVHTRRSREDRTVARDSAESPGDNPETERPEGLGQEIDKAELPEGFGREINEAELPESFEREIDEAELQQRIREVAAQKMADQMRSQPAGFYRNNDERAEEHRTSAYTLIFVGGIGLVAIVLFFFDLLPIRTETFSKYMISGVMGVLFVLFLVMGIISMKNSRILAVKAGKENNLTREIKNWCTTNIKPAELDALLFTAEEMKSFSGEIKYFKRVDKMREILEKQFINLEEGYLERLIDEVYPEMFDESEGEEAAEEVMEPEVSAESDVTDIAEEPVIMSESSEETNEPEETEEPER